MKKVIRLTEGDLHRIVKESVQRIFEANGDGMDSNAWKRASDARYNRALQFADRNKKLSGQKVSGQLSGLRDQISNRLTKQTSNNGVQYFANKKNQEGFESQYTPQQMNRLYYAEQQLEELKKLLSKRELTRQEKYLLQVHWREENNDVFRNNPFGRTYQNVCRQILRLVGFFDEDGLGYGQG